MGASLDKVCDLLLKTRAFGEMKRQVCARFASLTVSGVRAEFSTYSGPMVYYDLSYAHDVKDGVVQQKIYSLTERCFVNPKEMSLPLREFMPDHMIHSMVARTFGQANPLSPKKMIVPTYNLSESKVRDAFENTSRTAMLDDEEVKKVMVDAKTRILAQVEVYSSEHIAQIKQDCIDTYTVETIKKTLLQFKDARPEILKRALDEYVCHVICED